MGRIGDILKGGNQGGRLVLKVRKSICKVI